MKWKARLQGHSFDLQTLSSAFTGDPKVSVEADGHYVLEATAFDGLSEAGDVQREARGLLTTMNGAAKALDPSYRFVELAGHFENEQGLHAVMAAAHLEARSYMSATVTIVGGEPVDPPTPPAQAWMAAAATDDNVAHALRLLGSVADLDWVALYKLFEVVEHDVGGERAIVRHGWTTASQISAFGASANRPDVSGDAARHATQTGGAPKKTMSLPEGRQFVHGLVQSWLRWKAATSP